MRSILVTVMLVLTALVIYTSVVAGPAGTRRLIMDGGGRINETIERMEP
jgi:hypothetical protein